MYTSLDIKIDIWLKSEDRSKIVHCDGGKVQLSENNGGSYFSHFPSWDSSEDLSQDFFQFYES